VLGAVVVAQHPRVGEHLSANLGPML
jgi:hypothetical protein